MPRPSFNDGARASAWRHALLLVACVVGANAALLLAKEPLTAQHDNRNGAYPLRVEAARQWREGQVPLWNPYKRVGMPLLADTTAGAAYPGNLAFLVAPDAERFRNLDRVALAHFALAALFMFVFLRTLGLGGGASVLGGLGYGCSGTLLWLSAHYVQMQTSATWLPLVLAAIHRHGEGGRNARRWGAAGAMAVAMQWLAGYPEYSFYVGLLALGYAAALVPAIGLRRAASALAIVYAGGLALAAFQLLPALELQSLARRPLELGLDVFQSLPAAWSLLWASASPAAVVPEPFPPVGAYHLGVLSTLFLAASCLSRHRALPFLWLVLAVGVLLAVGASTPVSAWAYHLPLLGAFRHPFKHLLEVTFAASALAAVGADLLLRERRPPRAALAVAASVGLAVAFVALARSGLPPGLEASKEQMAAIGAALSAASIVALATLLLAGRRRLALAVAIVASTFGFHLNAAAFWADTERLRSPSAPSEEALDALAPNWRILSPRYVFQGDDPDSLLGDHPSEFRVRAVHGAGPYLWSELADATGMVEEEIAFRRGLFSATDRTLDVLSCRYVLASRFGAGFRPELGPPAYVTAYENPGLRLHERPTALARLRVAGDVACADGDAIASALRQSEGSFAASALVDCSDGYRPSRRLAAAAEAAVAVVEERAGWMVAELHRPAGSAAFVVFGEAAYPGWMVYAGDEQLDVRRVFGLLLGVEVPAAAGESVEVAFVYRPASVAIGAAVSLFAALALALWTAFGGPRQARS